MIQGAAEAGNSSCPQHEPDSGHGRADEHRDARRPASSALGFPTIARLELDELLDEVVARAQEVKATQGRLRALLAATQYVASDLELDEVLRRLVDAARELVGAQCAAMGLVHEGRLTQVVHRPADEPLVGLLQALPTDRGVLGYPVTDTRSVRLDDLVSHPEAMEEVRSHTPPIRSFLRAPVRAGAVTYGMLYLADERAAMFGDDDRELVISLAAAAGVAVRNATLLARARRRQRWTQAVTDLSARLLATDTSVVDAWQALLDVGLEVAEAHGGAVTAVDPEAPETVKVLTGAGDLAPWVGTDVPAQGSITRLALEEGGPVVVHDPSTDPGLLGLADRAPGATSVLAAPIVDASAARTPVRAVLTLIRTGHQEHFGDLEIEMINGFAAHAATILAMARARHDEDRLRRLDEREVMLASLRETVLARLMRSTLRASNVASRLTPPLQGDLLAHVDDLDDLTRTIRDTVLDIPDEGTAGDVFFGR